MQKKITLALVSLLFSCPLLSKQEIIHGHYASLIKNPTFGDGLLVSSNSNMHGLCRALGYEKTVPNSVAVDYTIDMEKLIIIDQHGDINQHQFDHSPSGFPVTSIICLSNQR